MDPVTIYRLGQLRHAEILREAEWRHQPQLRIKPVAAPIGRLLLAWGARLVASSGCANVTGRGYTITVCSAHSI